MRYLGGKARLAKLIADEVYRLQQPAGEDWPSAYLEPFMGGGSVMTEVLRRGWFGCAYFGDANRALVSMWSALQAGWTPPEDLTAEDYLRARANPDLDDAATAYLAFGGSFGAMWFGSRCFYPDQLAATRRSLLATRAVLQERAKDNPFRTDIMHYDYREWTPLLEALPSPAVIYCDPPYAGTLPYLGAEDGPAFDHAEFWATMQQWAGLGHAVLVSEYTAGPGAELVFERTMKGKMTKGGAAQDRLFRVRA